MGVETMLRAGVTGLCLAVAMVLPVVAAAEDSSETEAVAELRRMLADGEARSVETEARRMLAALTARGEAASSDAAELLDVLVVALWRGGRAGDPEAVDFAERAVALRARLAGTASLPMAASLDGAGVLFFIRGEYDRSRSLYERALAILNSADEHSVPENGRLEDEGLEPLALLARVHSHLGPLYQEMGMYAAAREHYREALRLELSADGRDRQVAMTQNNLATLLVRLGDYQAAKRLYTEAMTNLTTLLGADHPLIATARHNLGELYQRMGDLQHALAFYELAKTQKAAQLGPAHPSLAFTLSNLSSLNWELGRYEVAQTLAEQALTIQETALGPEHVDLAYSLTNLGRAQMRTGDGDPTATLQRALGLRSDTLGAGHPLTARPMHYLSEWLASDGKPLEAFDLALQAERIGRDHLRLTARGASERQALRYAAERPPSLDLVLALSADQSTWSGGLTTRAWESLIRSRGVVLDEVATRYRLANASASVETRSALNDYTSAIQRLSNTLIRGPDGRGIAAYSQRVEGLRRAREAAEQVLAARSGEFRRRQAQDSTGLNELKRALPEDGLLVSFARYRNLLDGPSAEFRYLAFVTSRDDPNPRVVRLGAAGPIETAVRRWRSGLARTGNGSVAYLSASQRLRSLVWDPLAVAPDRDSLVLLVPAGVLHLVNFSALVLEDGRFLVETNVRVHMLSSERDLSTDARAPRGAGILVAAGSPPATLLGVPASDCRPLAGRDFPLLPGSTREARSVARLWRAGDRSGGPRPVTLIGPEATESAIMTEAPGKAAVHLAAHGYFLANECALGEDGESGPLRLSGLLFAGGGEPGKDGVLTAEEIASLNLAGVGWVVLSGCDTGVGPIQADEGIMGLRRAFRVAGARTLVMSLWPVEDRLAATFMSALYAARFEGRQSTPTAMQRAYRTALAHTRATFATGNPLYWAPFIATGDWR